MAYEYKTANLWLSQFSSRTIPSIFSSELDEALIEDYRRYLPRAKEAGFDNLVIFGLIGEHGANQLPADLNRGFSPERDRLIRLMIDLIHAAGLKFVHGLGVYSWGYTNIIAAHPEVAGRAHRFRGLGSTPGAGPLRSYTAASNNAELLNDYDRLDEGDVTGPPGADAWGLSQNDLMCPSRESSWDWQERAIRFILERYDVDGFHLESADRGRCWCSDCRQVETVTYHARINERTGRFIKQIAPSKIVAVNTGLHYRGQRDLPAMRQMASGADFFIDCKESHLMTGSYAIGPNKVLLNDRPKIVQALAPTGYGSFIHLRDAGLDRSSWFLPAPRSIVEVIAGAYRDGCRAFEYYALGAWNNAGHELNHYIAGHALNHPEEAWEIVLEGVVDRLYQPKSAAARAGLIEVFSEAEMACFYNCVRLNMDGRLSGHPNLYLPDATPLMQLRYLRELERYLAEAQKLQRELGDQRRAETLLGCMTGALAAVRQSWESLADTTAARNQ